MAPLSKDESIWQHYIEEFSNLVEKLMKSFDISIEEEEDISDSTE
jgi:hypothetical protein